MLFERLYQSGLQVHDLTDLIKHDDNVIADIVRQPTGNTDEIRISYDPALHERLKAGLLAGHVRARLSIVSEGQTETISMSVARVYQDGAYLVLDGLHF